MNRNILFIAVKFLISAVLISFLTSKFDLNQIGTKLSDLNWSHVALTALCFVFLLINNTARWNTILGAIDRYYSFNLIFKIQYMGSFFNQTLPSTIGGDAVRIYIIHKAGATLTVAVNGIILERIVTLACLIFLVTLVQPFMAIPADNSAIHYIFPFLSLIMMTGIIVLTQFDRFPESLNRWKIIQGFFNLASDAKALFFSPVFASKSLFFGLFGNILLSLFAYQCAQSLGINLGLTDALVLIPPAILISALPISIAGWGVREATMVVTLSMAGISEADAFTLSVLFGLLMAAYSVLGGIIWLFHRHNN